jgi:hypothetical protein
MFIFLDFSLNTWRAIKKWGGENFKNWVCSFCPIWSRTNILKNKDDWPTWGNVMSDLKWNASVISFTIVEIIVNCAPLFTRFHILCSSCFPVLETIQLFRDPRQILNNEVRYLHQVSTLIHVFTREKIMPVNKTQFLDYF